MKSRGVVVVLAENLKLQVVPELGGRGDPPAHDRYVLLRAVNQVDILRGVGRGNEQNVAATRGKHGDRQKHRRGQCAAAGGPMRLARPAIQLARSLLCGFWWGEHVRVSRLPPARVRQYSCSARHHSKALKEWVRLVIVSQICETMIRMSHLRLAALLLGLSLAVTVAGCCGGAHSHKCDFTSLDSQKDAGSDGPMMCGTLDLPAAHGLLRSRRLRRTSAASRWQTSPWTNCEKPPPVTPSCTVPSDCDAGAVCCLQYATFSTQLPGAHRVHRAVQLRRLRHGSRLPHAEDRFLHAPRRGQTPDMGSTSVPPLSSDLRAD